MIQRIQSFWLFLAAAFNSTPLFLSFYNVPAAGAAPGVSIGVTGHYPSLLLCVVCTLLPLITIFFFGDRKKQLSMSVVCLVATGGQIGMLLSRVTRLGNTGNYGVSSILLPLALVVTVLAILGIRKDQKLVKSVDRLR